MKPIVLTILALLATSQAFGSPEQDRLALRKFYQQRLPAIPLETHVDGVYALDEAKREQWLEMEDFPPYEIDVEEGQTLFETPFASGKTYADCFADGGVGVKQNYPYFDDAAGQVITLELAINQCRERNGEQPLPWKKGDLAKIAAYMAFTSRDNPQAVPEPDSPQALAAYEDGKSYYYQRRGQLNFACGSCHQQAAAQKMRAETLSASLGHTSHWPVYRFQWEEVGTLHRRFIRCNEQVRAEPLEAQSETYRNLEYFLTYMSNGLPLNGPSTRR